MFDIGMDEMALIAVVALVVIGPKDLPKVLRTCGTWVRKARELAGEFQRGVDDMVRESELHELKSQVEKAADLNKLRRDIESSVDPTGDIARALEPPAAAAAGAGAAEAPAVPADPVGQADTTPQPAPQPVLTAPPGEVPTVKPPAP